jgi:uncharacterized protein (DUF433 family)
MVTELQTEHPHVVVVEKAAGRCAVIKGTQTPVWLIVRQRRSGDTPEAIVASLPHLTEAAVYDAISYYLDHRAELDLIIEELDRQAEAEDAIDVSS